VNRKPLKDKMGTGNLPIFGLGKWHWFWQMLIRVYLFSLQVNSVDANGNSILSLAVQNKCSNEVLTDLVTTYHADPNILNKQGTGPVEVALVYRDAETLTCLFEAGVNIKRGKNMLLQYAEGIILNPFL
jgi:hypothetical protein